MVEALRLKHAPVAQRKSGGLLSRGSGVRIPPGAFSTHWNAAERASPERTVFPHGLGEDRALSGVRRASGGQSRLAARSPPTEQARGVTGGIRTHDHRDHNPGLYQLSYGHRASDSVVRAGRLLAQRPDYRRLSDQC